MNCITLEQAQSELVAQELRCKELRRVIDLLESAQRRFDSIIQKSNTPNGSAHAAGLTEAVRSIINENPFQVFCTATIREILETRGFDTHPRVFGGALSTVLTRLGKSGFINITTDGQGNRNYQQKAEMP